MKRLLLIISILALVVLPMGCAETVIQDTIEDMLQQISGDYDIEVVVPEGLNFTGKYVVVTAAYDPDTYVAFNSTRHNVSGNVSTEYTVDDATTVGGMFQKQSAGNETLEVKIYRDGDLVDSASTTDPNGAVLVLGVKAE